MAPVPAPRHRCHNLRRPPGGTDSRAFIDRVNEIAREMHRVLWSCGGVEFAAAVMERFNGMPTQRMLLRHVAQQPQSGEACPTKDSRVQKKIPLNFRSFFEHLRHNRTKEDQAAIDAAIAALVESCEQMKADKTVAACMRVLGVSRHMINKCGQMRKDLVESDTNHWRAAGPRECASRIPDQAVGTNSLTGRCRCSEWTACR